MLVYLRPVNLYHQDRDAAALKPYQAVIARLPTNRAMFAALHSVADNTAWITAVKQGHYLNHGKDGIDLDEYGRVSLPGEYDGVVSVRPTAELTPGLRSLLLTTTVWIQKNSSAGPVMLEQRDITETVSLENAGAPLAAAERKAVDSDDAKAAARARARLWFAKDGHRLENALLFDLSVMTQNLRKMLAKQP